MATRPELRLHHEWLGFLQPEGLVVSPPALVQAEAYPNRGEGLRRQQILLDLLGDPPALRDVAAFTRAVLDWQEGDLVPAPDLTVPVRDFGEILAPTWGVPDPDRAGQWLLLGQEHLAAPDLDLDELEPDRRADASRWHASPQARFERLLRETGVPIGLLVSSQAIRLVYAPKGESSGHLTFPVRAMTEVAGRPIVAALHMLLSADRLFAVAGKQRLPAILKDSRRFQNEVSTRLAEQVLDALHELLRGFQSAHAASDRQLLRDVLETAPQDVYGGLLGTLLRLVFILYAEDRGLFPPDPVYAAHYSVAGLWQRLRDDAARHPDTMDQRFGAWAQLLTLFRLVHDGGGHGRFRLPARQGRLFNPDTWDFLEGRPYDDVLDRSKGITPPRVPDGTVYRVLDNLMALDGERLSYRALDVEQIGSVYEAMMGFELRVAAGASIGVRPQHVVVDVAALLALKGADRLKLLKDEAACDLSGKAADAVKAASTPDELVAALGSRVSPRTPSLIPAGGLYLQPTEERRRSGSHYTPRSLTEPIVRTTLEPVLAALTLNNGTDEDENENEDAARAADLAGRARNDGTDKDAARPAGPRPEQILDLKVCDPAMGSGAFLVEACRYLGDALVAAWDRHGGAPPLPPDEDRIIHARRLVATRCLYGVDKNPFAVDLAKLSLWLATLARDHPFTFLDHALRGGDSLVGLTRDQIASFHWAPERQLPLVRTFLAGQIRIAEEKRAALHALGDAGDTGEKRRLHEEAQEAVRTLRDCADLVIAAWFGREKPKDREALRVHYADQLMAVLEDQDTPVEMDQALAELRHGPKPVIPFHWELEFPEVFSRENGGFDAFVGNPPFMGGTMISTNVGSPYLDWLTTTFPGTGNRMDLVAYFFRRAFGLLRATGCFGLVGTNTIAQGDTRSGGLRWICNHEGTIYAALKRVKWPAGGAAVIVSVIHVVKKGRPLRPMLLDGEVVPGITAFLFHRGGHEDPVALLANDGLAWSGFKISGQGFLFADDDDGATPTAEMEQLIANDPRNREHILPYIGGEEVNDSPTHAHRRYVINFGDMTEDEARRWPDLMAIVEARVKPERLRVNREAHRRRWWQYGETRPGLVNAIRGLDRVLVCSGVSKHFAFAWCAPGLAFSHNVNIFALKHDAQFAILQSRIHDTFARAFSSTLGDMLGYRGSDCFETFPFPPDWETDPRLEEAGRTYYDFRAALMVRNNEGLTRTYNRFHDPDERDPDIRKLRDLHAAMDQAVLEAYGWKDLHPTCEYLLDYEEEPEEPTPGRKQKKKPWRYRWPDDLRDEVLARLLALNAQRAKEEALAGPEPKGRRKATGTRKGKSPGNLFGSGGADD